jgi:hypothetical protein
MRPGRIARAFFIAREFPLSFRPIGLLTLSQTRSGCVKGALLAQASWANMPGIVRAPSQARVR